MTSAHPPVRTLPHKTQRCVTMGVVTPPYVREPVTNVVRKKRTVVKVWRFLLPLLLLFYQNNLRFYHWIWFSGITTSWYITFAYKNIRLSITYKWRPSDINTQMWFTYCLFMVFFTLSQLKRNTWALISILITTSTFKSICIIM